MDEKTNITELKQKVKEFCEERDWDQFHDPKELSIGIVTEAAELLDHFRFKTDEQMKEIMIKKKLDIEDELADIMIFVLRFAQKNNIDLSDSIVEKIKRNQERYPASEWKGSNRKYNE